jgi:c-di-GMP-binding flagellar brake protein YcgR
MAWWSGWRPWFRRAKPIEPKGAERRESIRFGINLETSVRLIAAVEGDPTPARVRNISAGGISLVLNRGVDPDTMLNVQLLNRPQMFLCKVEVRVTYIVEHPTGDWILGGAFARKLTDEELRCLLT